VGGKVRFNHEQRKACVTQHRTYIQETNGAETMYNVSGLLKVIQNESSLACLCRVQHLAWLASKYDYLKVNIEEVRNLKLCMCSSANSI